MVKELIAYNHLQISILAWFSKQQIRMAVLSMPIGVQPVWPFCKLFVLLHLIVSTDEIMPWYLDGIDDAYGLP